MDNQWIVFRYTRVTYQDHRSMRRDSTDSKEGSGMNLLDVYTISGKK